MRRVSVDGIFKEGLRPGSYWATRPEIREYYAETIAGEGEVPVIIRVQVADLEGYGPQPRPPWSAGANFERDWNE